MRALRTVSVIAARRAMSDVNGLVVSAVFYLMVTTVLTSLWRSAAGPAGIAGYSAAALTWYAATAEAATIPLNFRAIEEIGDDIIDGSVAVELLRPVPPVAVRIAAAFGAMLPKMALCMAVGVAYCWTVAGAPPRSAALLVTAVALPAALLCNIVAQHAFAGVSFWIRDARSAWFIYQKFVFIVGGMLLPVQVLPDALETAALWLPFAAMAYIPARFASGHLEPWLLAIQLGWLVVLWVAARATFAAGERRLQVVGG
jgi:ABC-2 type transport system permease protein